MAAEPLLPDEATKKQKHRSFTVRVPMDIYIRMGELAQKESLHLNKKVNQLLLLGLGEHIKLDDVLMRLIRTRIEEEE